MNDTATNLTPTTKSQMTIIKKLEKELQTEIPQKGCPEYYEKSYTINNNGCIIILRLTNSGVKNKHLKLISRLTSLKGLVLCNNKITKIENLTELKNLKTINLDNNKITKIENLKELKKLKRISLNGNKITKIENLTELKKLEYVWLNQNRIENKEFEGNYEVFGLNDQNCEK